MVSADIIEIDIDPLGGCFLQRAEKAFIVRMSLVIDHMISAYLLEKFAFFFAARRPDDRAVLYLGNLHDS